MDPVQLQSIIVTVASLLIFAGVGGTAAILIREAHMGGKRRARLRGDEIVSPAAGGGLLPQALSGALKGAGRLGNRMATRDPAQLTALRTRLVRSGYLNREAVAIYLGARVVALISATAISVLFLPWIIVKGGNLGALVIVAGLALAAMMGPDQVVNARRKARETEYRLGFPDVLDLLVASVEAGLSLDAAVSRVTDEMVRQYPNLAGQLRFLSLELRAGRARKDAWTSFADRLGLEEARAFATMLRQAEDMGSSLGETLTVFSDEMRNKRMMRAEEKAMALPAKLIVPLILFILPCLLGAIMLPAAFKISQTLGQM